jgi:phenylpyruvate tautomerase PptA (4-oxalocrotonate tautomerase family)
VHVTFLAAALIAFLLGAKLDKVRLREVGPQNYGVGGKPWRMLMEDRKQQD